MSTVCSRRVHAAIRVDIDMATEVVGEIEALKPIAMPRPRRELPLPRSNGRSTPCRCREPVEHRVDSRVANQRARRVRPPVAQDVPAPELERVDAERARDDVGLALVGPHQLRNAEAAQRAAGGRLVYTA